MANIEKDTNQLLRDKYFVDAEQVLSGGRRRKAAPFGKLETSRVIDASHVVVSKRTVSPRPAAGGDKDSIRIHVVKENNRMVGLRIECPCGRHADLNCEYEPEKA